MSGRGRRHDRSTALRYAAEDRYTSRCLDIALLLPSGHVLCRRKGFAELAPATYLGWDGMRWDICDDFNRIHGIQSRFGGQVIVDNVTALRVVGKDQILATDNSGNMYLINVNEWDSDDGQSFAIESEWLDTLKAARVCAPTLRDPAALYK